MDKIKLLLKALILAFLLFWISIFTISAISIHILNINPDILGCTLALMFTFIFCTLLILEKLK